MFGHVDGVAARTRLRKSDTFGAVRYGQRRAHVPGRFSVAARQGRAQKAASTRWSVRLEIVPASKVPTRQGNRHHPGLPVRRTRPPVITGGMAQRLLPPLATTAWPRSAPLGHAGELRGCRRVPPDDPGELRTWRKVAAKMRSCSTSRASAQIRCKLPDWGPDIFGRDAGPTNSPKVVREFDHWRGRGGPSVDWHRPSLHPTRRGSVRPHRLPSVCARTWALERSRRRKNVCAKLQVVSDAVADVTPPACAGRTKTEATRKKKASTQNQNCDRWKRWEDP